MEGEDEDEREEKMRMIVERVLRKRVKIKRTVEKRGKEGDGDDFGV